VAAGTFYQGINTMTMIRISTEKQMKYLAEIMAGSILLAMILVMPKSGRAGAEPAASGEPTLTRAVMCESVQKFAPTNQAVVFSIDVERIFCFTEFDPVPEQTVIYHKWYRRGNLVSTKQFTLVPPRWSSSSSMQLRDADIGPWQVDVTDKNGKILDILRFSITD
jgi:Protein of unknown function (DUF2914)